MGEHLAKVQEAIDAVADGRVVIVVDAEDRENEGDFICAAEKVTPEIVNFMLQHGRGQLCMPILPELAKRLELAPMVDSNTARMGTPFTVTVDHVSCKTGVSAFERTVTIRSIIDPKTRPAELARPGHVHPLVAKEGGVLRRAGHTEATVDLARLGGLQPAGVLIEILDPSGHMAGRDRLEEVAREFKLPIITIEDLIRYRRRSEKLVERKVEAKMPTRYGSAKVIAYTVHHEDSNPIVLVMGAPEQAHAPLVRLHSSCFTGDLLDSLRCDCGDQLHMALQMIEAEGCGVLVYLPQEGRGIGLIEKLRAYQLQDQGMDTVEANEALGYKADMRDYGVGIQILKDLGLRRVRLLTNNPKKTDAFIYDGYNLQVVDQVPIIAPPNEHRAQYMATKRDKMGHALPPHGEDGERGTSVS